jgi:hypothetical protein
LIKRRIGHFLLLWVAAAILRDCAGRGYNHPVLPAHSSWGVVGLCGRCRPHCLKLAAAGQYRPGRASVLLAIATAATLVGRRISSPASHCQLLRRHLVSDRAPWISGGFCDE